MQTTNSSAGKARGLKILRVILILLLALTVILGVLNFILVGFVDFPCFVEYDPASHCINTDNLWGPLAESTRIEAFMTTYYARWSGGGCDHQTAENDALEIVTSVGNLALSREGEALKVNGQSLPTGERFEKVQLFDWHPWIIGQAQFTNYGLVPDCNGDPEMKRLVVVGSYGTQTSLLKGGFICLVLIAGLIFVQREIRRLQPKPELSANTEGGA